MRSSARSGANPSWTARILSWPSSARTISRVSSGRSAIRLTTIGKGDCAHFLENCLRLRRKPGLGIPEWISTPPEYSTRQGRSTGWRGLSEMGLVTKAPNSLQANGECKPGEKPRLPVTLSTGFLNTRSCLGKVCLRHHMGVRPGNEVPLGASVSRDSVLAGNGRRLDGVQHFVVRSELEFGDTALFGLSLLRDLELPQLSDSDNWLGQRIHPTGKDRHFGFSSGESIQVLLNDLGSVDAILARQPHQTAARVAGPAAHEDVRDWLCSSGVESLVGPPFEWKARHRILDKFARFNRQTEGFIHFVADRINDRVHI